MLVDFRRRTALGPPSPTFRSRSGQPRRRRAHPTRAALPERRGPSAP
jgi:hypothetical protein